MSERKILIIIILLALIIRGIYTIPAYMRGYEKSLFYTDSWSYFNPAKALISTYKYNSYFDSPEPETNRLPGYPFFLAVMIFLTNHHFEIMPFFFIVMSAVVCIPIFYITKMLADKRAGIVAAGLYAFNLTSIANAPLFLSDTLYLDIIVCSIYFFIKFYKTLSSKYLYLSVFLNALATLVRGVSMFWIIPCIVFIIFFNALNYKKRIIYTALSIFIFCSIVFLWMNRNHNLGWGYTLETKMPTTLYFHNCAALMAWITGESAVDIRDRWEKEANAVFLENPGKFFSKKQKLDYYTFKAKEILKKYPIQYFLIHFRPYILLPDAPTFLETMGITSTRKNTQSVLNSKGFIAAVNNYFGDKIALLFFISPLLIIAGFAYFLSAVQVIICIKRREIAALYFFLIFCIYYLMVPGPVTPPRYNLPAAPMISAFAGSALIFFINKLKKWKC